MISPAFLKCSFEWQLRRFGQSAGFEQLAEGPAVSPDVPPGESGTIKLDLPADWKDADALAVTVAQSGRPRAVDLGLAFAIASSICPRRFAGAPRRLKVTNPS